MQRPRHQRHHLGTFTLLFVAAIVAETGCADTPRQNQDAAAGNGGGAAGAGGRGGGGGSAAGGSAAGNAGSAGVAGTSGSTAGAGGASAGAGGSGGADDVDGGGGDGGSAPDGSAGDGGVTGTAGSGGTTGAAGAAGGAGSAGAAGAAGVGGAAGTAGSLGGAGGVAGVGGGNTGTAGSAPELMPPASIGLAVLNGDFVSTSVSLLTATGAVSRPSCVRTMTTGTGSTTISGDVTLPSQPQRGGQLVLIDRGNAALTFVDPASCTIDHQISVKGGFNFPNPHDVVILGTSKAYVTRYERNAAPSADPTTAGDDVLIVDPRDGTVRGNIPLAAHAAQVTGATILARPDRAVIAAGKVAITLNGISGDFKSYGEGRVVLIDPTTDVVVQTIALTGLKNCEGMDYLPSAKLLLVACGGAFAVQDQVLESGIALIDLSGATARLARVISAVAFNARPLNFQRVAATATGGGRAFVSTAGAFAAGGSPAVPDRLFVVDLTAGTTMSLGTSSAYDLGAFALTAGDAQLLVPIGSFSAPRVHVYDKGGTPSETGSFVADTVNQFPPRQVAEY